MTESPAGAGALTDEDLKITRTAAVRATALVSMAEKGFFDQFKEAFAASKAVKAAPAQVQKLMTGGFPSLPSARSAEDLETETLSLVSQAATVLSTKAPELLAGYRDAILAGIRDVAAAADDTSAREQDVIDKVTAAFAG
jgi:hypothetical protein